MRHLFLTLFMASLFFSCKNESKKKDLQINNKQAFKSTTHEYLYSNGTDKQYKDAYAEMFYVLKNQVDITLLPQNYFKNLQKGKEKSIADLMNTLAASYDSFFSKQEIEGMLQFYKSNVGKQLVSNPALLTSEQKEVVAKFYKSDLMVGVSKKHDSLTKVVSKVSEEWSRDLYLGTLAMIEAEMEKQKN